MCESDHEERVIIPPAKAREIVSQAGQAFLRPCPCRVQAQQCPPDTWEVCLLFEHASSEVLQDARPISTDEALAILDTTATRHVMYNLFYTHERKEITEICSCCTCCCRPLNRMKTERHYSEYVRSDYIAVTDAALCVGCGLCVEACFFEARRVVDGVLHLATTRCFGCGRCVASCPSGAIHLERKAGRGVVLPGDDVIVSV